MIEHCHDGSCHVHAAGGAEFFAFYLVVFAVIAVFSIIYPKLRDMADHRENAARLRAAEVRYRNRNR